MAEKKSKKKNYRRKLKDSYQHVNFCIMGDSLNPDKITKTLSIEPDYSCKKNDFMIFNESKVRSIRTGRYRKHKTGMWQLDSKARENSSLENKINSLIRDLLPKKDKLRSLKYTKRLYIAIEPDYNIAIRCISLPIKLIKTLSELGIEIELNIDMPHQMKKYHDMLKS